MNLEEQADILAQRLMGWEQNALQRIGKRIKERGKLTKADLQTINNIADVKSDIDIIMQELSAITGQDIADMQKMYSDLLEDQHLTNQPLYDYRNKTFVPFAENKQLQAIVTAYARETANTMINLSKTKMLGFFDESTGFKGLQETYLETLDKAVAEVTSGATDFYTAMRETIENLGGSGLRVDYGGGVTRRLDTVVRSNILYGAKQASIAYNDSIGEEVGADGFEVDWHSNPRPSHEFMQGKQFAYGKAKTVDGIYYPPGDEALERLQDYNCQHYKKPIILGVTEPTFSKEELARLNEQNKKEYTIDGNTGNGYFWTQKMRQIETEVRKQKDTMNLAQASGDNELVKSCRQKIKAYNAKYNEISEKTGIAKQPKRMTAVKQNT